MNNTFPQTPRDESRHAIVAPKMCPPLPLPNQRSLGNILNDLLAQCKEINDTLDVLRGRLEPIIAAVPATNVADGPSPFVPTNANELAVSVERDLRSIHRRLHELLDTVSL